MKIVIYPAVEPERLTRIKEAAGGMVVVNTADEETAIAAIAEADAFFGKLTKPMLASAKKLRWVQSPTASLEHYVFPELVAHPCTLTNMRGLYSDVIADHVLGYIVCFARNFHRYIRNQIAGRWEPIGGEAERSDFISGPGRTSSIDRAHMHLADATLGIVGFGYIGREIADRGRALGMRVLAIDSAEMSPPEGVEAVWPPSRLDDLLAESDFVVIAAPHTPATEKLIRLPQLQQMKSTAYLINIGRGAIVDLADLTLALSNQDVAGAGLDVFEKEPLPPDHPLWKMENVIITPHIAGTSPRIAERHTSVLLENIRRFRQGAPLVNVANKALWY